MRDNDNRSGWDVVIGGEHVATVSLADSEVTGFRLRLDDVTAQLWLASYVSGGRRS